MMDSTVQWLLEGDPAIRWQTLRDLAGAPARRVTTERNKIATEGWGARLLEIQDPQGSWGRRTASGGLSVDEGLYSTRWTSTTYTMLLLRDFSLPANNPQARKACTLLLDRGMRPDGGINYGTYTDSETCITGMVFSILCHFGLKDSRLDTIADHLLKVQMPDGGWNCRLPRGATHASMNTTISVLEGLHQYTLLRPGTVRARRVRQAMRRGQEFLLLHRLFRSHRTGKVILPDFKRLTYPPRWHYNILRALDHFQAVDAPRDDRLTEAIDIIRRQRGKDGRWKLEGTYPGKTHFQMERVGQPSRWVTLLSLRVLKWWDGA
jgi:hypothetical protein